MTEFKDRFREIANSIADTIERKNHDYAQGGTDPFFNFEMCEKLAIAPTEVGMLVRMTDKLARVISLAERTAKVQDESIHDTLHDLAAYAILMSMYIERGSDVRK